MCLWLESFNWNLIGHKQSNKSPRTIIILGQQAAVTGPFLGATVMRIICGK